MNKRLKIVKILFFRFCEIFFDRSSLYDSRRSAYVKDPSIGFVKFRKVQHGWQRSESQGSEYVFIILELVKKVLKSSKVVLAMIFLKSSIHL